MKVGVPFLSCTIPGLRIVLGGLCDAYPPTRLVLSGLMIQEL